MRIIPVIDCYHGSAVHARFGKREQYQPVSSILTGSTDPLEIARIFVRRFQSREIYLADLDAIIHRNPSTAIYQRLFELPAFFWIDAGVRNHRQIEKLLMMNVHRIILGLETIPDPDFLTNVLKTYGHRQFILSFDTHAESVISPWPAWRVASLQKKLAVLQSILDLGMQKIILLDLARVGSLTGTAIEPEIVNLTSRNPQCEWTFGGGIRSIDDVLVLQQAGFAAVLIATALHNGAITPENLELLHQRC